MRKFGNIHYLIIIVGLCGPASLRAETKTNSRVAALQMACNEPDPASAAAINDAHLKCGSMYSTTDKQMCLSAISKAYYLESGPTNACKTFYNNSDVIQCFEAIVNKTYRSGAVSVCSNLYNTSDKQRCFAEAGRRQPGTCEFCDPLKALTLTALDSAIAICRDVYDVSQKIDCLRELASVHFLEPAPVSICRDLYGTEWKLDCLKAIRNRSYTSGLLTACQSNYDSAEKVRCLSSYGLLQSPPYCQSGGGWGGSSPGSQIQGINSRHIGREQVLLELYGIFRGSDVVAGCQQRSGVSSIRQPTFQYRGDNQVNIIMPLLENDQNNCYVNVINKNP